jgi:hypothetical protein
MDQATTTATAAMANADTDIDIDIESTTTTKPTDFIVMTTYWDEWSRCIGSRYQRDHMYRVGRLDTCSKQWKDFKIAARAKVIQWKEPARAEEMIQNTYYKKRTTISPTAGAIWEFKEKPGWD